MLDGIPPSPRGMPQVEVTFDIDANGILTVTAKDKASGKSQNIVIKDSSALNKDEIEKMKKEAEAFAEQDKKKKEIIDLRNQADQVIYSAEKALKDAGDKAPADIKKLVEEKISAIKAVKDGNDASALKKALDELQAELSKIGEAMYKGAAAGAQAPGAEPQDKKDEGPIEGEVQK